MVSFNTELFNEVISRTPTDLVLKVLFFYPNAITKSTVIEKFKKNLNFKSPNSKLHTLSTMSSKASKSVELF